MMLITTAHTMRIARTMLVVAFGVLILLSMGNDRAYAIPITQQVNIQPIVVCDDAGANCAVSKLFEAETVAIWAQAGVEINFLTSTQLNETDYLTMSLSNPMDFAMLFFMPGNGQNADSQVLNMWFVDDIIGAAGGTTFGVSLLGGNGIVIADETASFNDGIGRLDTIAHEIGHNLGLAHYVGDDLTSNLMADGSLRTIAASINDIAPNGAQVDQLTMEQISTVVDSSFSLALDNSSQPVPEPSTLLLFGSGLAGLVLWRRKRASVCTRMRHDIALPEAV